MRVLVTGSAGYVGPVVVRALREQGHDVVGYDIGWFGTDADVSTWFIRGDIREPLVHPSWPEVVVHLAGLSNDPMGDLNESLTLDVNYDGTMSMADHYPDARHVVISSCAVYGVQSSPASEDTPTNPQTLYAEMKDLVDHMVHQVSPDLNAVSLRLGTVYGYAPNHRLDLVVNKMVWDALNAGGVTVNGNAARPLVHVEDVARAVVWAVEGSMTGIVNVIGENIRMKELGRAIAGFASVPIQYLDAGADNRDYMASGSKALSAGWYPTRTVEGSLSELFGQTLTLSPDREYVRLTTLRRLIDEGELDPKTLRHAA